MQKINSLSWLIHATVIVWLLGCNIDKNRDTSLQNEVDTGSKLLSASQEKIVVSFDSLEVYDPFNASTSFKSNSKECEIKVFVYTDVSCSSCLLVFEYLDSFFRYREKPTVEPYVICYAKDNFFYFQHLYEEGKIPRLNFPLYFDRNQVFYRENKKIVLDYYNNILFTGTSNLLLDIIDPQKSKGIHADMEEMKSLFANE